MSTLADRIEIARVARGLSRRALEKAAHLSKGYASRLLTPRFESQRSGPDTLKRVADALQVNYAWLVHDEGPSGLPSDQAAASAATVTLETVNDRAWYAWHCLPRVRGKPPTRELLEVEYELPRNLLSQLFDGAKKSVRDDVFPMLAEALGTSVEWLRTGKGTAPELTGPIRPRVDRYAKSDPAMWVKLAPQLLGQPAVDTTAPPSVKPMSEFDVAVQQLREELSPRAITIARGELKPDMSVEECRAVLIKSQQKAWREATEAEARCIREAKTKRPASPRTPASHRKAAR